VQKTASNENSFLKEVTMKTLIALVLATVSISCGYIFAQSQLQSTVKEGDLTPERAERLKKEFDLKDVAFVVAIDFDGNVRTFAPPDKKHQDIDPKASKSLYPHKADAIQNVFTTTFVAFKGSECIDYIDSNGYKKQRCR
jgi:hypothetical protein